MIFNLSLYEISKKTELTIHVQYMGKIINSLGQKIEIMKLSFRKTI